jgi:LAS superfamily LD-carboxypeptidase LdcB
VAAEAAGLDLTGSGYRSHERQIELRRAHCGTSDYAVYEMPSSQCSPPTARPGASMHEQGLAIDFSCDGKLIESRSHPCFTWLAANAPAYGLANLPSEPWHWSTNGR